MSGVSKRHPANNGKVMLIAWVDSPLRDRIRREAKRTGISISDLVASALRGMIGPDDEAVSRAIHGNRS